MTINVSVKTTELGDDVAKHGERTVNITTWRNSQQGIMTKPSLTRITAVEQKLHRVNHSEW